MPLKCTKMHIIASDFSKNCRGSRPPDPLAGLGLRPSFAVCTQVDWCLEISLHKKPTLQEKSRKLAYWQYRTLSRQKLLSSEHKHGCRSSTSPGCDQLSPSCSPVAQNWAAIFFIYLFIYFYFYFFFNPLSTGQSKIGRRRPIRLDYHCVNISQRIFINKISLERSFHYLNADTLFLKIGQEMTPLQPFEVTQLIDFALDRSTSVTCGRDFAHSITMVTWNV